MTIFIDNGTSGSIAVAYDNGNKYDFLLTPIVKMQSYTKAKNIISRIDVPRLIETFTTYKQKATELGERIEAYIERPMVNPERWKVSLVAVRALEATIVVLEALSISYSFCDSKEWQREMLPKGIKGSAELKKASMDIGLRRFPEHKELIAEHGDADSLLGVYHFYRA